MHSHSRLPRCLILVLLAVTLLAAAMPASAERPSRDRAPAPERAPSDAVARAEIVTPSGLLFVENVGQFDKGCRYRVYGAGTSVWLSDDAVWIALLEPDADDKSPAAVNLRLSFEGANATPRIEPMARVETKMSYLIGADEGDWRPDVPVYVGVRYVNLYPGLDLEMFQVDGRWSWKMVAGEGLKGAALKDALSHVKLNVEGGAVSEIGGGHFVVDTALGSLAWPLVAAPDGDMVAKLEGSAVVAPFGDGSIEPSGVALSDSPSDLLYGTFLGETPWDASTALAMDSSGCAYVAGDTESSAFPAGMPGVPGYDNSYNGGYDAYVVKLNATGTGLIYGTFLGGGSADYASDIAVSSDGCAFVGGATVSTDFCASAAGVPGYDKTHNGGMDAFALKLNRSGTGLIYATYLGGSNSDGAHAVALAKNGALYLTGGTWSSDFPASDLSVPGYIKTISSSLEDAFICQLSADGTALGYATYYGGSHEERGLDIAVDSVGAAYVVGQTESNDLSGVGGAPGYDTSHNGGIDGFAVKLDPAGTGLGYATYLGGSADDYAEALALDNAGALYAVGRTWSTDMPAADGGIPGVDKTHNGLADAYALKLDASGASVAYATYLGGSDADEGYGIAVDGAGCVYVTGATSSSDFIASGAEPGYDKSHNLGADTFLCKLNAAGTALTYGTFLGGSATEVGYGIALGGANTVYVSGHTYSVDHPASDTSVPGYDKTHAAYGQADAYVLKLSAARATPDPAVRGVGAPWVANYGRAAGWWFDMNTYPRCTGDVNGDGMADIVAFGNKATFVSLSTGSAYTAPTPWIYLYGPASGGWSDYDTYPRMLGDVNGDGMDDIVAFGNRATYVSLSTGSGFLPPDEWIRGYGPSAGAWTSQDLYPRMLGDVNGDGMDDIVAFGNKATYVSVSTGTAFAGPVAWILLYGPAAGGWWSYDTFPRMVDDVDGDGMDDIVAFGNKATFVSLSTGSSFGPPMEWAQGFGPSAGGWMTQDGHTRLVGDVDGDGKSDVVAFGANATYAWKSTTQSLGVQSWFYTNAHGWTSQNLYPRDLGDADGNGKVDIVGFGSDGTYVQLSP